MQRPFLEEIRVGTVNFPPDSGTVISLQARKADGTAPWFNVDVEWDGTTLILTGPTFARVRVRLENFPEGYVTTDRDGAQ